MKNKYSEYIKKDESAIKDIWSNGLLTFDTNILQGLYAYSKETSTSVLNLIDQLKEKVFLTYHVGLEYNRNKYQEISDQVGFHKEFLKNLERIESELNSKNKPPFLTKELNESLTNVFNQVKKEVNEQVVEISEMLSNDWIYSRLINIFDNRVEDAFSEEDLKDIHKQGKDRYEKKIPPGYMDKDKPENSRYGDLIIWKEILRKSKHEKKSIILVTNDSKEDWIWKLKNKKSISAHHLLIKEFKEHSNLDFHIYNLENFLHFGQQFVEENLEKAIDEISTPEKPLIPQFVEGIENPRYREVINQLDVMSQVNNPLEGLSQVRKQLSTMSQVKNQIASVSQVIDQLSSVRQTMDHLGNLGHINKEDNRDK